MRGIFLKKIVPLSLKLTELLTLLYSLLAVLLILLLRSFYNVPFKSLAGIVKCEGITP